MATIAVVEDNQKVLEMVVAMLDSVDHKIIAIGDGAAALEIARSEPVDIVISDVVLPYVGGVAVIDAFRKANTLCRAILISGYPEDEIREEFGIPSGCVFLQKPFTAQQLRAAVSDCLEKAELP